MHKFENLKYSHDNYYWLLKRYPKLLTRDKSKLGYTKFKVNKQGQYMNEHEIVEYILSLDEQLKKAYDIYQEYLVSNQIATLDMAEQLLNQLIDDYKASNITEYVPAWKLLENWHDEMKSLIHLIELMVIVYRMVLWKELMNQLKLYLDFRLAQEILQECVIE